MPKVLAVIRREFVERVRSKWFWVSAILVPLFLAAVILLPAAFASSGGPKRIVVVDGTGSTFGQRVTEALRAGTTFQASRVTASPGVIDSLMRPRRRPGARRGRRQDRCGRISGDQRLLAPRYRGAAARPRERRHDGAAGAGRHRSGSHGAGGAADHACDTEDLGVCDHRRELGAVVLARVFHGDHSLHGDPHVRGQREELGARREDDADRGSAGILDSPVRVALR